MRRARGLCSVEAMGPPHYDHITRDQILCLLLYCQFSRIARVQEMTALYSLSTLCCLISYTVKDFNAY
jgi:hypothetical protein